MNPVRTLARPLLASAFVAGGIDTLRNAGSLAPVAEPVTTPIVDAAQPVVDKAVEVAAPALVGAAERVADAAESATESLGDAASPIVDVTEKAAATVRGSAGADAASGTGGSGDALLNGSQPLGPRISLPDDPELLTTVNGAVMVAAGALLAIGRMPRVAALALAATLVPTTLAAHRFWEIDDDEERRAQQMQFAKNLGLLGGLALATIDTEGRPGVAWRARHASRTARREARLARRLAATEARRRAGRAAHAVTDVLPG